MKKKNKYLVFLAFLGCFSLFVSLFSVLSINVCANVYASDNLSSININSSSKSCVVYEANSGRNLYQKNSDQKLAMASTTKIVTAITFLENFNGDLDKRFTVDSRAVGIEGTSMYLKEGEEVTARELLYGLMLPSGNDAALALAYAICDEQEKFCSLMHDVAQKAGALNSGFANPHGLDQEGHYTTALDLAKITAYALKNDTFKDIVSTKKVIIEETNKYQTRYFKNKNRLLFEFDNCIGVKTGFTDNAGRCLVTAVEQDDMLLICVVLNCPDMFEESERLLKLSQDNFDHYVIVDKSECVDSIFITNGNASRARIYPLESFECVLSKEEYSNLKIEYQYEKEVEAPIKIQDVMGKINVFCGNDLIFTTNLCSIDNVKSLKTKDLLNDILKNWR